MTDPPHEDRSTAETLPDEEAHEHGEGDYDEELDQIDAPPPTSSSDHQPTVRERFLKSSINLFSSVSRS
jgi:hypothetical protein